MNTAIIQGTNAVAVGAVVSPLWMPWLQTVSDTAALLLPIAGLMWLVIQMLGYFWRKR